MKGVSGCGPDFDSLILEIQCQQIRTELMNMDNRGEMTSARVWWWNVGMHNVSYRFGIGM